MFMTLRREVDEMTPGRDRQRRPDAAYVSQDAAKTLKDIHRQLATLNVAPVSAVADEAMRYKLWSTEGMTPEEIDVLMDRLRVLTRVNRSMSVDADKFVDIVRSQKLAGADDDSSLKSVLRTENDKSWDAYRRQVHDFYNSDQHHTAIVAAAKATKDIVMTPAPKPKVRRHTDRPLRPWEIRRREQDAYYEERCRRKKDEIDQRLAAEAAASFDARACVRRCLEPLSEDDEQRVIAAIRARDNDVVIDAFNIEVKGEHTQRLRPKCWLIDELINFYFELLKIRDEKIVAEKIARLQKPPSDNDDFDFATATSHFFNSYFFVKLLGTIHNQYNYKGVRRWTKRFDIFKKRYIFIPVNVGNMHWTLIMINMEDKIIRYFDSMAGRGELYLNATFRYLQDEHKDKKQCDLPDPDAWSLVPTTANTPQQHNGYDCGVFATFFAHWMSIDATEPDFDQSNIIHLRRRMMLSILDKDILV